MELLVTNLFP